MLQLCVCKQFHSFSIYRSNIELSETIKLHNSTDDNNDHDDDENDDDVDVLYHEYCKIKYLLYDSYNAVALHRNIYL